jgi:glutamate synthase (NADPH/NADH) small chain
MGKPTGFVEWPRKTPGKRPVALRLRDWREVEAGDDPPHAIREQAGRCMDCGVPFCEQGCPLGNHIPDWNDLVHRDRWHDAWLRLAATNDLPEMTGRLCPAPCEAACTLAINTDAVTIEAVEKAVIERAFAEGWVEPPPPRPRTGRRVAVVGSGPAGLAAAAQLAAVGHAVTVFEKSPRAGGLLRYGIPDFKLEKWVIDRRLGVLAAGGIEIRTGADVGVDPTWSSVLADHDAVLIAVGAQRPRELDVPGRDLDGVVLAMDYLSAQNQVVGGERPEPAAHDVAGQRVVILGGGDTGSDCLGTALRQGAASAIQLELLPAPPPERRADNPWPQWPVVFRTSSSQEEGGDRMFALRTTRLSGTDGRLTALHAAPYPDGGDEIAIECDVLVLALGFVGVEAPRLVDQLGVAIDRRGAIAIDRDHRTSVPGVYAAGDAHRGSSLIVWAIADGRAAARAIDGDLRGGPSWLPVNPTDR